MAIYEQRNNNEAEVYNGITCVRCDYVNLHFSDIYVIIYIRYVRVSRILGNQPNVYMCVIVV